MTKPTLRASAYSTRFRHVSSEPVIGPAAGEDSQFDDAVLRGDLKVIGAGTTKAGVGIRYCMTKGKTYRLYPVVAGKKRRDHRADKLTVAFLKDLPADLCEA